MNRESILHADGISKKYDIYGNPKDRLKQMLCRGTRKFYQEFWALKNVSLEVGRGESIAIIGQNGAGKSTLLQILAGTLTPTEGAVKARGKVAALLELGSGFNPDFTGRENIYIYASILGLKRREIESRMPAMEAFADIGEFLDKPVRIYSTGMQMRLAFSVATHVEADILLIDEVLAVGDVFFHAKCMDRLRQLQKKGISIVLSSHDMHLVRAFCKRAILLDKGRLEFSGNPAVAVDYLYKLKADVAAPENLRQPVSGSFISKLEKRGAENEVQRHGNHKAVIEGFRINDCECPKSIGLQSSSIIKVEAEVHFNQKMTCPIFGVTVRDWRGIELMGNNTLFQGISTGDFDPGDRIKIQFELPLHLNNGSYFLILSISELSGGTILYADRWVNACSLEIQGGPFPFVGFFNLDSKIEVQRINKKETV